MAAWRRLVWVCGIVAGLTVSAQQDEPRMVDLNVIALDSKGQAVTDLTRDELKITDNGKPQTIAFFHHRDSTLGAVPKLGLNEVSNRGGANVPRATVILFDLLNERFGTRGAAANRIVHDLGALESADYLYLYCLTINGSLFPVHGLPGPEDEAPAPGAVPWTHDIKGLMDKAMRATMQVRPPEEADPTYRIVLTYRALDAIANELARVPGRKSLVWVTDGIPTELGPNRSDTGDFVDFTPQLRQLSDTFDRSAVSIYSVRQVMIGSPESMGPPGSTGMGSIDTLDQFAELTGGRPDAGKDIGAAVRQAIADMKTSYQVGFYPPESAWDNKFHKLKITSTRKGVKIQAKSGYYAWAEPMGARSEQAIAEAAGTKFDAAEIGLRGKLTRSADGKTARLEARIDAHDVTLVQAGDKYTADLRLAMVGYAPGHEPSRGPLMPVDLRLSAAERDKALADGLPFTQEMTMAAGIESVRLIVYDRGSNAIGSVTLSVAK